MTELEEVAQRFADRFGDFDWEARFHRYQTAVPGGYGYFIFYGPGGPDMADVRAAMPQLVDEERRTVILHQRRQPRALVVEEPGAGN